LNVICLFAGVDGDDGVVGGRHDADDDDRQGRHDCGLAGRATVLLDVSAARNVNIIDLNERQTNERLKTKTTQMRNSEFLFRTQTMIFILFLCASVYAACGSNSCEECSCSECINIDQSKCRWCGSLGGRCKPPPGLLSIACNFAEIFNCPFEDKGTTTSTLETTTIMSPDVVATITTTTASLSNTEPLLSMTVAKDQTTASSPARSLGTTPYIIIGVVVGVVLLAVAIIVFVAQRRSKRSDSSTPGDAAEMANENGTMEPRFCFCFIDRLFVCKS
jgi:hypothetical protein